MFDVLHSLSCFQTSLCTESKRAYSELKSRSVRWFLLDVASPASRGKGRGNLNFLTCYPDSRVTLWSNKCVACGSWANFSGVIDRRRLMCWSPAVGPTKKIIFLSCRLASHLSSSEITLTPLKTSPALSFIIFRKQPVLFTGPGWVNIFGSKG